MDELDSIISLQKLDETYALFEKTGGPKLYKKGDAELDALLKKFPGTLPTIDWIYYGFKEEESDKRKDAQKVSFGLTGPKDRSKDQLYLCKVDTMRKDGIQVRPEVTAYEPQLSELLTIIEDALSKGEGWMKLKMEGYHPETAVMGKGDNAKADLWVVIAMFGFINHECKDSKKKAERLAAINKVTSVLNSGPALGDSTNMRVTKIFKYMKKTSSEPPIEEVEKVIKQLAKLGIDRHFMYNGQWRNCFWNKGKLQVFDFNHVHLSKGPIDPQPRIDRLRAKVGEPRYFEP